MVSCAVTSKDLTSLAQYSHLQGPVQDLAPNGQKLHIE